MASTVYEREICIAAFANALVPKICTNAFETWHKDFSTESRINSCYQEIWHLSSLIMNMIFCQSFCSCLQTEIDSYKFESYHRSS